MQDPVIKAVETDDELHQANDLMAKAHCADYFSGMEWLSSTGQGYPDYLREHTRVALWGGRVAAALRITTDTIRIGEARLRTGGIGWVTTAKSHRKRGLMALVMDDALRYMREHRYHVSMLFGIPDFYHRWGFATALAEYATTIRAGEADASPDPRHRVRNAKPGDIPVMNKIHLSNDSQTACSLIRTTMHMANKWRRWASARVLTNQNGKVLGYFRGERQGDVYVVDECGVADAALCGALLNAAAREAHAQFLGVMRFCAPPDHPLIRHLVRFRSDHEMATHRDGNGMMALVHTGETLESMIPEWESRLQRHFPADGRAEATLAVNRALFRVRAIHGAIDVGPGGGANKFSLSPQELMQLITGHRHLEEVLSTKRRIINQDGLALLRVLFPKRSPFVWQADRF